jgi:ferric-dicitrate binding protein FerR (iron transport regulator)
MDIQVLGTSFNVSTYEDNMYPMVSLIEGAVQVKTGTAISKLTPGQRASIDNDQIHVGLFDIESEIAWKNDYFLFKNKNIKEIMSDLARWYGAEVEYQGENWADKNYTIRISRRENIEEILSIIELTESVKFKIKGRRIIVVT